MFYEFTISSFETPFVELMPSECSMVIVFVVLSYRYFLFHLILEIDLMLTTWFRCFWISDVHPHVLVLEYFVLN